MPTFPALSPYTPGGTPANFQAVRAELGKIQRAIPNYQDRVLVADATMLTTDAFVWCDCTNGPIAYTLLLADQAQYFGVWVVKTDASANAVTITGTVSGAVNPTLATQYKAMYIRSNTVAYFKLAAV